MVRVVDGEIVNDDSSDLRQRNSQGRPNTVHSLYDQSTNNNGTNRTTRTRMVRKSTGPLIGLANKIGIGDKNITIPALGPIPANDIPYIYLLIWGLILLIWGIKIFV